MTLGEKLRYLREVEGTLRGLNRAMTQSELTRAISSEQGRTISQAYLSQVENGHRKHLTDTTRMLLARFFRVHPGYLVNDPEGFHSEPEPLIRVGEDRLDLWLIRGAERFAKDPEVSEALLAAARNEKSRDCLILLGAIAGVPDLAKRLLQVLRPESHAEGSIQKRKVRRVKGAKR